MDKHQRYRLKDLEGYRKRKREYARTPEQRAKRTAYMREWREKNREKHNAYARAAYARNRDKPEHKAARDRWHMVSKYGITPDDYDNMLEEQSWGCAICGRPPGERRLHIDHCHKTGKVRGLLCTRCNTCLAWFEDHKDKAADYIDNWLEDLW
jgi:hypothetical protein